MHFYNKNHFQSIVKIIGNDFYYKNVFGNDFYHKNVLEILCSMFLYKKSFPMYFYSKKTFPVHFYGKKCS